MRGVVDAAMPWICEIEGSVGKSGLKSTSDACSFFVRTRDYNLHHAHYIGRARNCCVRVPNIGKVSASHSVLPRT